MNDAERIIKRALVREHCARMLVEIAATLQRMHGQAKEHGLASLAGWLEALGFEVAGSIAVACGVERACDGEHTDPPCSAPECWRGPLQ